MTTPSASSNDEQLEENSKRSDAAAECEAGLRRVLAYICAQRHRRLIAYGIAFLLLFSALQGLFSLALTLLFSVLSVGGLNLGIFPRPIILGVTMYVIESLLPFAVTVLIFVKIARAYKAV